MLRGGFSGSQWLDDDEPCGVLWIDLFLFEFKISALCLFHRCFKGLLFINQNIHRRYIHHCHRLPFAEHHSVNFLEAFTLPRLPPDSRSYSIMASDIQQSSFVKQLAANGTSIYSFSSMAQTNNPPDRPTRDKALESLRTFLSGRRDLPPLELLKLWKGLFYCMWMSDRPRPQQALANSLADLVSVLPRASTIPFLRAFWQTMQREWTNIDVLRMEKFLLLTRRYLCATFKLMKEGEWEEGLVEEHLELLKEVPCNTEDMKVPNGMRYHVIDIYVDELERVGALEKGREGVEVEKLLGPLRRLAKESPTKPVRNKSKEALADDRLPGNEKAEVPEPEKMDGEWGGIE